MSRMRFNVVTNRILARDVASPRSNESVQPKQSLTVADRLFIGRK